MQHSARQLASKIHGSRIWGDRLFRWIAFGLVAFLLYNDFWTTLVFLVVIGFFEWWMRQAAADDYEELYQVASAIVRRQAMGKATPEEWHDLLAHSGPPDKRFKALQAILAEIPSHYPPGAPGAFCSDRGRMVLMQISEIIREKNWDLNAVRAASTPVAKCGTGCG